MPEEAASLRGESDSTDIAVKEFRGDMVVAEQDPDVIAEVRAWDVYQKASLEARVMVQLCHPHILGLVGLTLQPLRLLVELAPLGDLKGFAKKFKRVSMRLSRKTIQTTLIQVHTYACILYKLKSSSSKKPILKPIPVVPFILGLYQD